MKLLGLGHLSLFVSDLQRSLRFYTVELGFRQTYYEDRSDIFYAEIEAGSCAAAFP